MQASPIRVSNHECLDTTSLNFDKNPFFKGESFSVSVSTQSTSFSAISLSDGSVSWEWIWERISSNEAQIFIVTFPLVAIAEFETGALKLLTICADGLVRFGFLLLVCQTGISEGNVVTSVNVFF